MLLNYVGDDTFEVYENFLPTGAHNTYEDVIEAFDLFMRLIYETHFVYILNFLGSMKQQSEETSLWYFIHLKEQFTRCHLQIL